MSEEIFQLGKRAPAEAAAVPEVALPHTVELPARYYGRLAVAATVRAFAEVATVETRIADGAIALTFTAVDPEAGPAATVIDELLNHALHASAIAAPEARS